MSYWTAADWGTNPTSTSVAQIPIESIIFPAITVCPLLVSKGKKSQHYFNIAKQSLKLQGVPKKIGILSSFEFLYLGGVFLGVKNNSENFGNKKYIGFYRKILSK